MVGFPSAETLRGAHSENVRTGGAYVFTGSGASWSQQAELTAADGAEGDEFGKAVAISGSTVLVGADQHADGAGAAYVFTGSGASWSQQDELTVSGAEFFGEAVAISGSTAIVGAPGTDAEAGAAYVFTGSESSWTEQSELIPATREAEAGFGYSLGVSGSTLAVGAPGARGETGAAYVYELGAGGSPPPPPPTERVPTESVPTERVPPCETSKTLGAVTVLADCIAEQGNGTYLASGGTRFADGASIVIAGTQTPAPLIIDPATNTIALAPASGGGAQTGELKAGGVGVGTGPLTIDTQGGQDPVSGIAGSAKISGLGDLDLALSGWSFGDLGIAPTAYLVPSGAGGGAVVDGQLELPAWLGAALQFGLLGPTLGASSASGQLAVQVNSGGSVSVVNGGISFQSTAFGIPQLKLTQGRLTYQRAGDVWSGTTTLGLSGLSLAVNVVIGQGKLDDLGVNFACGQSGDCSGANVQGSPETLKVPTIGANDQGTPETPTVPTIGAVLNLKDASLQMINLQGISYTPFSLTLGRPTRPTGVCVPFDGRKCPAVPPPPPAPQVDGQFVAGALGEKVIIGGGFTYLLDGAFSAEGTVGLAPLFGHTFPIPAAITSRQTAKEVVNTLLKTSNTGVELAAARVSFTPPHLLQASGTVFLPPPPFPLQFLRGSISIGIDPPHFTGEGSLDLIVPGYVPIIGGDTFGGVAGLISDKGAAAEASLPRYCIRYLGCTPKIGVLIGFDYQTGKFTFDIGGGNINEYATVTQASASSARAQGNSRTVHVPGGKQMASFTISSARGTPNVQLIGPPGRHRRTFTLASSRRLHNRTGALSWTNRSGHSESFIVFLPPGGPWSVSRLSGPPIRTVKVTVPLHKLRAVSYPRAAPRASDLPRGAVSTNSAITLHYSVPHAPAGTTVEIWAGTGPHGAGGVMVAEGLPPSGAATWKLAGLPSGRYWPYVIVNENGVPASIQYWPHSVEVVNPAAPAAPTGIEAAPASGQVLVAWNEVPAAATYAITATPAGGGAVVRDAVPASQLGDELTLPPGQWSITVQAVDAADELSLPSAASSVTVP